MMHWLVDVSIRLRIVILLVAGMLMIGWLRSAGQIPFDVFPELAPRSSRSRPKRRVSRPLKSKRS